MNTGGVKELKIENMQLVLSLGVQKNITAVVEISSHVPEGSICTINGVGSGWSLYTKGEYLVY